MQRVATRKKGGDTFNTGIAFNNKLNQSFSILSEHKIIWRTFKEYWWPGLVPDKLNQNQDSGNGIFIKSQMILTCSHGWELLSDKLLTVTWLRSVLWIKRWSFFYWWDKTRGSPVNGNLGVRQVYQCALHFH